MDESEIEGMVGTHFKDMDRQIRDWSPEDAKTFMEFVSSAADDRLAGLENDIEGRDGE